MQKTKDTKGQKIPHEKFECFKFKTMDYDAFKTIVLNRSISKSNLESKIKLLKENNLLRDHPIKVSKSFEVYDGQHRLAACKILQIPVWYEFLENEDKKNIQVMNSNSDNWKIHDYLHYHNKDGNNSYERLDLEVKKRNIPPFFLVSTLKKMSSQKNLFMKNFKEGKFVWSPKEDFILEAYDFSLHVVNFIASKLSKKPTWINNNTMRTALVKFCLSEGFEREAFLNSLERKISMVRACAGESDWISMFKEIYNYRKRDSSKID